MQHDTTIILGDFNAVTGSDRHGFESVIGNYGSGRTVAKLLGKPDDKVERCE